MRTTVSRLVAGVALAAIASGCGDVARQGRGPSQVVITSLTAASITDAGEVGEFSGVLNSDVITNGSIFDDHGAVRMTLILKDPSNLGVPNTPSVLNQVTFTRYRVTFRRSDGRNAQGVDVPYAFDGGMTLTVSESGSEGTFLLVRHIAKLEAPLKALSTTSEIIYTLAEIQFFGRDQAGNDVTATGVITVNFGNFADPDEE